MQIKPDISGDSFHWSTYYQGFEFPAYFVPLLQLALVRVFVPNELDQT